MNHLINIYGNILALALDNHLKIVVIVIIIISHNIVTEFAFLPHWCFVLVSFPRGRSHKHWGKIQNRM
jgi:hypothetical protein